MWVFGYGSLVWKVDFPYEEKIVGYVKGFHRRFYQYSVDHRGTPKNPGRVVTLIPADSEEAKVYGIAYKIKEEDIKSVVSHLDHREKGGYERVSTIFYPKNDEIKPFQITIYLAGKENPQYAGPDDLDSIANQIVSSVGPSGPNVEYVCNLAKSMREIAPEVYDDHLYSLENLILQMAQPVNGKCLSRNLN